ncbi:N-acetylglucosamine kinase 1 [Candida viswanathii]|uniref:Phosphotransferase n=1 Tax=Candida viswanathii TaxID=5486 RepID=A0A367YE72_9ASCO|nr:N-acetylglucosamine kinase 1 [Candida viswanathii]
MKDDFGLTVEVCSILNDSLAVYSAGCFIDDNMKLAMVLGTGLNMCCSLNKSDELHPEKLLGETTLFNCEASLFGQNLCDTFATNGRYLPELTRLVLVDLVAAGEIFQNVGSLDKILHEEYDGFSGEVMCLVHETEDYDKINEKLCEVYSWTRFIVANTILAFFKLLEKYSHDKLLGDVTIGYVGSVLNYFHDYRSLIISYVNNNEEAKKLGLKIDLKLIDNSSIIGAAIGAAYYSK